MRKVFAIAAIGLLVLAMPALAVIPPALSPADEPATTGGGVRTPDCPGTILWDYSNMDDAQYPPSTCAYIGTMTMCFINADTTGSGGFPEPERREGAVNWIAINPDPMQPMPPLTHVKAWYRYNTAGWELRAANPGSIHGFCVKIFEANQPGGVTVCPDQTVPGDAGLGVLMAEMYAPTFTAYNAVVPGGVSRQEAFCISLPQAFYPVADKSYWISVSPDFDCIYYTTSNPTYSYYSFVYWRFQPGQGIVCEGASRDGWNAAPASYWAGLHFSLACFAGFDFGCVLYSGDIPVATEPTTWGKIKANYR